MARLASIVESSDDAMIGKDLTGTIVSWNRGAEAIYGYAAEEAVGRSINLLVPPERLDEEQQILARIGAGQRIQHFDTVRVRKGGTPIDVSLTISPVWEGGRIVGASHVARDISERKRLEAGNARLAAIVESSEDAIISKDLSGIVETWNSGAERVYGYAAAEAAGRSISFLLPAARAHEEREILARVAHGERVQHFETQRLRKDGTLIDVSVTISPIRDTTGQIVGASHVARDITERRAFEEQMRQTQRLESVGLLAGGIAHDFNNLLTGIIGNASLIGEELPPQGRSQEFLAGLMMAAKRAAELTAQLLAYSGRGRFVVGPVHLSELISEIHVLVRASVSRNITIRLDLADHLPPVHADRNQLHQLLMNLVLNGAEAIGEDRAGCVTVRTGAEHLDQSYIRAALSNKELASGEYVWVEVRDDGCGMDEATRARIFDPFFTTKFMGRGLGLAAALGIVQGHNGAIRVSSTPGYGSTFKVFLPAGAMARRDPPRHRGTVLVVDDEEMVRQVARVALESCGYTVLLASDGREGVEMVETAPSIGLVILDITMPIMGGEEALRRMRALHPDLPIVLSSGYSEAEARRRFEAHAIAGFLQKPYTSAAIRKKVEKVLVMAAAGTVSR
jgi:two-component system, cell cycle sensor histidine kinase and response regulator CckA